MGNHSFAQKRKAAALGAKVGKTQVIAGLDSKDSNNKHDINVTNGINS